MTLHRAFFFCGNIIVLHWEIDEDNAKNMYFSEKQRYVFTNHILNESAKLLRITSKKQSRRKILILK